MVAGFINESKWHSAVVLVPLSVAVNTLKYSDKGNLWDKKLIWLKLPAVKDCRKGGCRIILPKSTVKSKKQ